MNGGPIGPRRGAMERRDRDGFWEYIQGQDVRLCVAFDTTQMHVWGSSEIPSADFVRLLRRAADKIENDPPRTLGAAG